MAVSCCCCLLHGPPPPPPPPPHTHTHTHTHGLARPPARPLGLGRARPSPARPPALISNWFMAAAHTLGWFPRLNWLAQDRCRAPWPDAGSSEREREVYSFIHSSLSLSPPSSFRCSFKHLLWTNRLACWFWVIHGPLLDVSIISFSVDFLCCIGLRTLAACHAHRSGRNRQNPNGARSRLAHAAPRR